MLIINQLTITGTNRDTRYILSIQLLMREVTNIMFVYIVLISRKINIFLNIQSEENVTYIILSVLSEPDILLRFKLHLNSYICRIQWNKV